MDRRLWFPALASLAGLALLAAAAFVGPARGGAAQTGAQVRQGGTLKVNISNTDIEFLDPALNYDFLGWQIEQATCAKLLNYPDKNGAAGSRLKPEVATGFPRVGRGGRQYTFTIRPGFRFNTGAAVTATSFSRAIERALSPKMQSPAASFLTDVVGAAAVMKGKGTRPAGVTVKGNTLTVRLTKVAPDFLARFSMPFFCAIPDNLPIDPQGVNTPPAAGPYYVASKTPDRQITVKRNPYYRGNRPHNVDEMVFTVDTNLNTSYLQVQRGDADYDASGLPPAAHAELTRKYGINKGRYWVHPSLAINYVALNTRRPLFKTPNMRKAVGFAVDRRLLIRQRGLNAGTPSDQLLPPGMAGYRDAKIYPSTPNVTRARQLTGGRTGKAVLITGNDPISINQAQILKANLGRIGIEVEIKNYPFAVQIARAGRRDEPFDMNAIGWYADYPDPYDFINILLYGKTIQATNNVNTAYFNKPAYNRKMTNAARLSGNARYAAYARLDADISRNQAPLIVTENPNVREFIGARVGCYIYSVVAGSMNLANVCLKQ
jgi:peptide/nickel transport system substrate-binding protein